MDVALGCLLAANAWRTARWTAQKKQWIWPWGSFLPARDCIDVARFRGLGLPVVSSLLCLPVLGSKSSGRAFRQRVRAHARLTRARARGRKASPRTWTPKRGGTTGKTQRGDPKGRKKGETQLGRDNGETITGKWCKMRNVTFIFKKNHFYPSDLSTIGFKTLSGSFSRYWNEIWKFFFRFFFDQICWKMRFLSINSIHNEV